MSVISLDQISGRVSIGNDLVLAFDFYNSILDATAGNSFCNRFFPCEYKRVAPSLCLLHASSCLSPSSVYALSKVHDKTIVSAPALFDLLEFVSAKWYII